MPRKRDPNKPKRNVWTDPSPYGTYEGPPGNPDEWRAAFEDRMGRPEAQEVLGANSPWEILGLKPGATKDEIKRAWRKYALQWHPDVCKGDKTEAERKFKEGKAAYSLLTE